MHGHAAVAAFSPGVTKRGYRRVSSSPAESSRAAKILRFSSTDFSLFRYLLLCSQSLYDLSNFRAGLETLDDLVVGEGFGLPAGSLLQCDREVVLRR